MSTRKPKPSLPSFTDLPSKQLQLITVTSKESRAPARRSVWSLAEPVSVSERTGDKRRLH